VIFASFLLPGCGPGSGFKIQDLAKTNIDTISEIHMNQAVRLLKSLTRKLYKKNPSQLKKGRSIPSRLDQIFRCPCEKYAELDFKDSTEYILQYWDKKWISIDTLMSQKEKPLVFDSVPQNALFWLVEKDSRKEERIFIFNGNQIYWY